jgi:TnpA family transposase
MKRYENENKKLKKKAESLQKERDNMRHDVSKTNTQKGKLESLCRQLQKDNNELRVRAALLAQGSVISVAADIGD